MLQKGDSVVMHTCDEAKCYEGRIWFCSSNEFTSSSGTQIVYLEKFSGYFMVDYLQKVKFDFNYLDFLAYQKEKEYKRLVFENRELLKFQQIALKFLSK